MIEALQRTYFHNSVQDYLIALGVILFGLLLVRVFRKTILTRIHKWSQATETHYDDFVVDSAERFGIPALNFAVIYIGINCLTLTQRAQEVLKVATTVVITFLVVRLVSSVILLLLQAYVRTLHHGEEKVKQLGGLMLLINIVIWASGLLFLFDNMGYDVTAIVTGLGIGGIAVALAAQNILGDLFNYFVIFFDRPFEVGDFIVIDDKAGTVDYMGIKTTRINSITGEQLVVPNSDLTKSRVHNFKRMTKRRVVFTVKVTYQTALEQLKEIPTLLRSIVEEQSPVQFDRSHFTAYGDSSLNYEVVYYVLDADYNKYMDIQQAINLRIYEEFQHRGIEFAYPTQALVFMNQRTEDMNYQ